MMYCMQTPLSYRSFFKEEEDESELPGEPFWGDAGAGALFLAKDTGRFLVFLRSETVNEPGTWNLVGGKLDYGENAKQAVARELSEETGYDGDYKMYLLHTFRHKDFRYDNFLVIVPFEFTPQLNWEHDTSKWIEYGDWPTPLHFGLADVIKHECSKLQRISAALKKRSATKSGVKKESVATPPAIIQPVTHNNTINYKIVVTTLWGEARGEGEKGMQAVMNVIMNRANGNFNQTRGIVLAHKQFSMWNNISNAEVVAAHVVEKYKNDKSWKMATHIVDLAESGKLPDITGGATSYFNPQKPESTWVETEIKKIGEKSGEIMVAPSWAGRMNCTVVIKNHIFLKPIIEKKSSIKKKKVKEDYRVH